MNKEASFNIMVADDEMNFREIIKDILQGNRHNVICSESPSETLKKIVDFEVDLLLLDNRFPHDNDGIEVLKKVKAIKPGMEVVMLTAYPDAKSNLEAIKYGAFSYLFKTDDYEKLSTTLNALLEVVKLRRKNILLLEDLQRKNAELEKSKDLFQTMNERLMEKMHTMEHTMGINQEPSSKKTLFLRALFHEMRNRLTVMQLYSERMNSSHPEGIANCVQQISAITEQMCDVMTTYHELIYSIPQKKPVGISDILKKAYEITQEFAQERKISFHRSIPSSLPAVWGSSQQLIDCFFNLLKNAIEAATSTSFTPLPMANVECIQEDNSILVRVESSGPEISEEIKSQMFLGHFSTKGPGRGLGLTLVQYVIETHNGSFSLERTQDEKNAFLVRFPIQETS